MLSIIKSAIRNISGELFDVDNWMIDSVEHCGCRLAFLPHRPDSVVITSNNPGSVDRFADELWKLGFDTTYPLHLTPVTGCWSERMSLNLGEINK